MECPKCQFENPNGQKFCGECGDRLDRVCPTCGANNPLAISSAGHADTGYLHFEGWPEILGPERLTGALLDRLTHRVHIVEANGEKYRLRDAKKRLKQRSRRRSKDN